MSLAASDSEATQACWESLDEGVQRNIISFLSEATFLFISLVNKRFRHIYQEVFSSKKTSAAEIVGSLSRAKLVCDKYEGKLIGPLIVRKDAFTESRNYPKDIICQVAARHGNKEVIQWARNKGYPWNASTCQDAARSGHLLSLIHI